MLIGSYESFQGPALDIVYFVLFFINWFEYKHFRSTLDEDVHFILLLSFIVSIWVLNSRSRHLVFLGVRPTFQVFFVKKLCFSLFLLNSIDKFRILDLLVVNSFIWWFLFLFHLELKYKEKSFRVYRGQWKTVFFVLSLF